MWHFFFVNNHPKYFVSYWIDVMHQNKDINDLNMKVIIDRGVRKQFCNRPSLSRRSVSSCNLNRLSMPIEVSRPLIKELLS